MKKFSMGHGAGSGLHKGEIKRAYRWLWRAWLEALAELPVLRWLAWAVTLCAGMVLALAVMEGRGALEIFSYAGTALLLMLMIPAIAHLLYQVYRRHRSDAIFHSRQLGVIIRSLAREEIAAFESEKQLAEGRLFFVKVDKELGAGKRS